MLACDDLQECLRMFWDALFKLLQRVFKMLDVRLGVVKEELEQIRNIFWFTQIELNRVRLLVLVEDSLLGILKYGVD